MTDKTVVKKEIAFRIDLLMAFIILIAFLEQTGRYNSNSVWQTMYWSIILGEILISILDRMHLVYWRQD